MAGRSDAATDRVSLGSAPSTAALTIAGWARIDSAAGGSFNPVIRLSINAGDVSSWIVGFKGTNGRTPSVYSPSNVTGISAPEMTLGTWVYLAATLNAGSAQLLYGTVPGALSKVTGTVAASGTADRLCFFGRSAADGSEWLAGALAYQRIWTAVLSDAEIAAESQSATVVQASNLWASWPFAAAALTDASGNARNLSAGSTALDADTDPVLDTGPGPLIRTSGFQGPGPFGRRTPWAGTSSQSAAAATQAGDATLTGSGSLTAAADTTKPAAATVTATGTITAAATVVPTGDATLTGVGALTATALTDKPADATLTGTVNATASAGSTKSAAAALTGTGSLTAATATTKPVDAALAGTGAVTAAAATSKPATASLTVVGTITADATVGAAPIAAAASLAGVGSVTAAAERIQFTSVSTLTAVGTITASCAVSKPIAATLAGLGTFTLAVTKTITAAAALAAVGAVAAAGSVTAPVTQGSMSPSDTPVPAMTETDRPTGGMTPTVRSTSTMTGG